MKKVFVLITALLLTHSVAKADITDADFQKAMDKYLATDKGQEALGGAIEKFVRGKQEKAAKEQAQQAEAQIEDQFKNPVKIDAGNSPVRGPKDAKITIVEFSDFQCPYCKRGKDTMDEVMKAYPKDVKIVFKNLPLPFHPNALPAAKAALAANKQGKFWDMHDAFFDNQGKLGDSFYEEKAKELGLNLDQFKKDMASDEIAKQIEADKKIAEANQIQGTPGFFVNGVAVKGAYPTEHFKMIIDRWLNGGAKKG